MLAIRKYHKAYGHAGKRKGASFPEPDQCEIFTRIIWCFYWAERYYTCSTTGDSLGKAPCPFFDVKLTH